MFIFNTCPFDLQIPEEDWDDPNARGQKTGTKEITTHCSVHTLHLDGLRELYRHFLRLPEGSIVEVCILFKYLFTCTL